MEEITTQSVTPLHTTWYSNKWNLILVVFIALIISLTLLSYGFIGKNNTGPFSPGSTYEGVWQAPGFAELPAKLTINSRKNNNISLTYSWSANTSEMQSSQITTIIQSYGKTIAWGGKNKSPRFTFTWVDENHLNGKREQNNITATVTMTKKQ